jgi:hypothetical protein
MSKRIRDALDDCLFALAKTGVSVHSQELIIGAVEERNFLRRLAQAESEKRRAALDALCDLCWWDGADI